MILKLQTAMLWRPIAKMLDSRRMRLRGDQIEVSNIIHGHG